jgi:hypothetical protein
MAGWDMFIQKNVSELHQKELGDATWGSRFRVLLANHANGFCRKKHSYFGGQNLRSIDAPMDWIKDHLQETMVFPMKSRGCL